MIKWIIILLNALHLKIVFFFFVTQRNRLNKSLRIGNRKKRKKLQHTHEHCVMWIISFSDHVIIWVIVCWCWEIRAIGLFHFIDSVFMNYLNFVFSNENLQTHSVICLSIFVLVSRVVLKHFFFLFAKVQKRKSYVMISSWKFHRLRLNSIQLDIIKKLFLLCSLFTLSLNITRNKTKKMF